MRHSDRIILQKISAVIDETEKIFSDISLEDFLKNSERKLAMGMSIIRVGELVKTLSAEFRLENSHVAWKDVAGFRDVVAHRYNVLDFNRVYGSIKYELPELKSQIEKILEAEEK